MPRFVGYGFDPWELRSFSLTIMKACVRVDERVLCHVRDNGIDPDYLERIFNLFERLDSQVEGTGIGFSLSAA